MLDLALNMLSNSGKSLELKTETAALVRRAVPKVSFEGLLGDEVGERTLYICLVNCIRGFTWILSWHISYENFPHANYVFSSI